MRPCATGGGVAQSNTLLVHTANSEAAEVHHRRSRFQASIVSYSRVNLCGASRLIRHKCLRFKTTPAKKTRVGSHCLARDDLCSSVAGLARQKLPASDRQVAIPAETHTDSQYVHNSRLHLLPRLTWHPEQNLEQSQQATTEPTACSCFLQFKMVMCVTFGLRGQVLGVRLR